MLTLKARQIYRKELDTKRLQRAFQKTFCFLKMDPQTEVTLQLTDDKTIQKFNLQYRDVNEATDVLSFENAFTDPESGATYLGDILISFETAKNQAEARGQELMAELEMLLVHGLLHLIGMDHSELADWEEMSAAQDSILSELNNPIQQSIHKPA